MQRDNIASTQPFVPAAELGIELHPLEAEATAYLSRRGPHGRLDTYRTRARR